jgi:heterodisulfide reductase subunit A-like polyferredoxin
MERKGYWKLDDIRGIAVPSVTNPSFLADWVETHIVPKESVMISIDREKCNSCGVCTACYNGAIEIKSDHPIIDLELCDRCGICASICPRDAIALAR